MDTPPPIPPTPPKSASPEAPARDATTEKLLKRASHAGRNLSMLAILATLGSLALIAAVFFVKGMQGFMAVLAVTITMIASAYWVLAVAARRGNPNAVGIVMVVLVLQICLAMISSGVQAARTHSAFQLNFAGLIIPVLIIAALASSRKILVELKERQLWDQVFASAKPSGNLCLIGGALLVTGFVALNADTYYVGWKAGEQQMMEIQTAKKFVEMIQGDEQAFITAMQDVSGARDGEPIETALNKLQTLEQHFGDIKKEAADVERLRRILGTYESALRQWKNALTHLKEPDADTERVKKMLELGDRFRAEAGQEFDRRYTAKSP